MIIKKKKKSYQTEYMQGKIFENQLYYTIEK